MLKKNSIKIFVLGTPLILGMLAEYLIYITDSIMVGRLGTTHLAAIAIATTYGEILWLVVWSLAPGTQSIASRRFGKLQQRNNIKTQNNLYLEQNIGEVLYTTLWISILAGMVCFLIAATATPTLNLLLDDQEVIALSLSYIDIIKWAMPFGGVFFALYGFLAAINRTKVILFFTITQNVLNLVFNFIFIFGYLGIKPMGISGAALGTVIAQILTSFSMILLFILDPTLSQYNCLALRKINWRLTYDILRNSLPVAFQTGAAFTIYLIYETLVGNLGTVYLAATHVILIVLYVNKSIIGGLAEGCSILVGNALGRKDEKEALGLVHACEVLAIFVGIPWLIVILIFPEFIVGLFNSDPGLNEIGVKAIYFFTPFFFFQLAGFCIQVVFNANGSSKFVLYSEFSTNLIFILGGTALLTQFFAFGIYGAWTGFGLYLLFHSFILFYGFTTKNWLKAKVEH